MSQFLAHAGAHSTKRFGLAEVGLVVAQVVAEHAGGRGPRQRGKVDDGDAGARVAAQQALDDAGADAAATTGDDDDLAGPVLPLAAAAGGPVVGGPLVEEAVGGEEQPRAAEVEGRAGDLGEVEARQVDVVGGGELEEAAQVGERRGLGQPGHGGGDGEGDGLVEDGEADPARDRVDVEAALLAVGGHDRGEEGRGVLEGGLENALGEH